MGKKGGPYLTSGLKHSFRKGKRRGDEEEKNLSKFRVRSKPPFTSEAQFGWGVVCSVVRW